MSGSGYQMSSPRLRDHGTCVKRYQSAEAESHHLVARGIPYQGSGGDVRTNQICERCRRTHHRPR